MKPETLADVGRGKTVFAVSADGAGVVTFGQPLAPVVADQAVVVVAGRRQAEQALQQSVDRGGVEQVFAPDHIGDGLCGVVDHHGKMVGGAEIAPGEDDIADLFPVTLRRGRDMPGMARVIN